MKRLIATISFLALSLCLFCEVDPRQQYIDTYASLAVKEMYRSGVPASITLAQGVLESRAGLSELASEGNNHFGIKCHDWKGKTMKVDDDRKGECFRVYSDPYESYRDHSDFLRFRDRYKFLFDYPTTDYKSWAYGLSKAGYATDPQYPQKLIKIIEDYNLSRFDSKKPSEVPGGTLMSRKEDVADRIPESPALLEVSEKVDARVNEEFHFSLSRTVYRQNGVLFLYSTDEDTYKSLAEENNLFLKEILRFNDLPYDRKLLPGTVVYLRPKKKIAARGIDKYIVESDGEKLRDICQRFAVQEKSIMKLNKFEPGHILREGDTVKLRKR